MKTTLHLLPARRARTGIQFANIGEGAFGHGRKSYLPDATAVSSATARYLMYKSVDGDHCTLAGAGDSPLGPSDNQPDSTTTPIAINLLGAGEGTLRVTTDGMIGNGDYVKCAAAGQVTKATTGDVSFGRAVITGDMTSAAGNVITLIPALPAKYSF